MPEEAVEAHLITIYIWIGKVLRDMCPTLAIGSSVGQQLGRHW